MSQINANDEMGYCEMNKKYSSMKTIQNYIDTQLTSAKKREKEVNILRDKFVADFPVDSITNLSIDDFVIAAKGFVKEGSFCYRIRYELSELASMGNMRNGIFGVYKVGNEIRLSKGLQKRFRDDYNSAFEFIKSEMVSVINAAKNLDYDSIEQSELSGPFILRLMMVYYPESVFNACAKSTLINYCKVVGLELPGNYTPIQISNALLVWRDNHMDIDKWSNYLFMALLDWLRRKHLSINGEEITLIDYADKARKIDKEIDDLKIEGKTKEAMVKVRVNQGVFRDRLFSRYNKCCLCNVNNPQLLVASHIKPWSVCQDSEKLLVDNGFLMCPNHDSLFDNGLITFNDDGRIIISDKIDDVNKTYLNIRDDMKINVIEGNVPFLKYHREHVYVGQ